MGISNPDEDEVFGQGREFIFRVITEGSANMGVGVETDDLEEEFELEPKDESKIDVPSEVLEVLFLHTDSDTD